MTALGRICKCVFHGSLFTFACSSTPQITSRKSAQRAMDTPTRFLTCRFLSDTWEKTACKVQVCHGRSRVTSTLRSRPPTRRCRSARSIPATRRHRKYPSTQKQFPGTLWLHSSPSIPFTQPEARLNGQKVRMKSGMMVNHCQVTFILKGKSDLDECSVLMLIQTR